MLPVKRAAWRGVRCSIATTLQPVHVHHGNLGRSCGAAGRACKEAPPRGAALEQADLVVEGTVTQVVYTPSATVGTVQVAVGLS